MLRKIIKIDEDKCDGCGECIPSCHEGALRIIEGKCRLISDLFCDGLGACVGNCSKGALEVIEGEAQKYDEVSVIKSMLNKPQTVLKSHLIHLLEHDAVDYFNEAAAYLESIGLSVNVQNPKEEKINNQKSAGCPGSAMKVLDNYPAQKKNTEPNDSMLGHWPVQLHLMNPFAPYLKGKELVILSTCSPVAYANTHTEYLKGKAVVLACPKLDYTDPYPKKLEEIFKNGEIKKAVIVRMEVPCCGGLTTIALKAAAAADLDNFELSEHIISTNGYKVSEKVIFTNNKN